MKDSIEKKSWTDVMKESDRNRELTMKEFNETLRTPDTFFQPTGTFGYGYWHTSEKCIVRIRRRKDGMYNPASVRVRVYEVEELDALTTALSAEPKDI